MGNAVERNMRRSRSRLGSLSLALGLLGGGCVGSEDSNGSVSLQYSTDVDGTVQLSQSPSEMNSHHGIQTLFPGISIGGSDGPIEYPLDLDVLSDGRTVVLDGGLRKVFLFDMGGGLIRSFGRPGDGPGEFQNPYAVVGFGSHFVVLSSAPTRVFSVFDTLEGFLRTSPPPVDGDWARVPFRFPVSRDGRFQVPLSEDITSRVSAFSEEFFLHSSRADERTFPGDSTLKGRFVPTEALISYDSELLPLDTVAVFPGPPSVTSDLPSQSRGPWAQLIWAPRTVWTARDGMWAVHQPGTGEVNVRDREGRRVLRLQWPIKEVPLKESDRLKLTEWIWIRDSMALPTDQLEILPGRSEKEMIARRLARIMPFSEVLPEISWMGISGDCLLISPFDASSNILGVSRSILVVDLRNGTPRGLVKLEPVGIRIRAAGPGGVWASRVDEMGSVVFQRYTLPFDGCNSARGVDLVSSSEGAR